MKPSHPTALETEFERELIDTYREAAKHGYHAACFRQMIGTHGGVHTAKRLLAADQVRMGLFTLKDPGLLRINVENLVLDPKYDEILLACEKRAAFQRLTELAARGGGETP